MTCKTNDTELKCGNCCSGVCNTAAIGCTTDWQEWPEPEALLRPDGCATTQSSNGAEETEEILAIGVDPAVRARVWRWAMGLSVGFWVSVALLGLRGCWG